MKTIEFGRCRLRGSHCATCRVDPKWRAAVGTTDPCGDDRGPAAGSEPPSGPGTELKKLLAAWGIGYTPSCSCNRMAAQMDRWGPKGCREHMKEIVDVMAAEATLRGWKLPLKRMGARGLVLLAIRRSKTRHP